MDGYMLKPPTRTKLRTLLTQYLAARQSVGGVRIKGGLMTQVRSLDSIDVAQHSVLGLCDTGWLCELSCAAKPTTLER